MDPTKADILLLSHMEGIHWQSQDGITHKSPKQGFKIYQEYSVIEL